MNEHLLAVFENVQFAVHACGIAIDIVLPMSGIVHIFIAESALKRDERHEIGMMPRGRG